MLKIKFTPKVESELEEETIEGVEVAFVVARVKGEYWVNLSGAFSAEESLEIPRHVHEATDWFAEHIIKDAVPRWMTEELLRSVSAEEKNDDQ